MARVTATKEKKNKTNRQPKCMVEDKTSKKNQKPKRKAKDHSKREKLQKDMEANKRAKEETPANSEDPLTVGKYHISAYNGTSFHCYKNIKKAMEAAQALSHLREYQCASHNHPWYKIEVIRSADCIAVRQL